ncbi:MAG: class II fructose-bisphosphate aldolase [Clostridia bacterium]|nr:class II fructose-bisphosphate aldolase [Clostridia bacterium]
MLVNLNAVLKDAQKNRYAVGLFNTTDMEMLQGVIEAAEETKSPVIIGTAEVLLPYGELKLLSPSVVEAAKRASVPVVVHYDHGLTFDRCIEALQLGYSSIMFDGSANPYDENIAQTKEIVKIAHSMGATVEGEIGHVGQANDSDNDKADLYTTVEQAKSYIAATGVDALAISIGTAHGKYITKPQLDLNRLAEIREAVDTPLVLHGGSGLSDDDFRNCVKGGIAKINIYTDLCIAGEKASRNKLDNCEPYTGMNSYLEMRNMKVEEIKKVVKTKMELFGSVNKA